MHGHYPDAAVLHFKGERKPFMLPYWRQHICATIRRESSE